MRAFAVAWRALVSLYNDLVVLIGMSLLWWVTGGLFVGAAVVGAWFLFAANGPWWLAPLLAIPAGPATAALASVARRSARDLHADRGIFLGGLRLYWRQALALGAVSMLILALLLLNMVFYLSQASGAVRWLGFLWAYLTLFWAGAQIYLFAVLVGLQVPNVWGAYRLAAAMALANPLFSLLAVVLVAILTALSVVLTVALVLLWPALMALVGEHSVKYLVERASQRSA